MKLDINLTYLKCFYDAALMGSVTESARRNFVSQSAVSQAIAKLEKSLGVLLCLHKKQHFKLTEEGEIVFQNAKEIFSAVRRLHDALDRERKQPKMPLNFVTTHSVGLSLLPDFLAQFKKIYPDTEIHFQFGGLTQIKGWLKQGIAEFALVLESSSLSEYQIIELYQGNFGLYKHIKEKHPIQSIGAFVEHQEGFLVSEFQAAYREMYGHIFPVAAELNSWEFIARCQQNSLGYGLLPDLVSTKERYPYLKAVAKPILPYTICAAYLKGEQLSYSAQTFLDALKTYIKTRFSG